MCRNEYFHVEFPQDVILACKSDINALKLLGLTIAIKLWAPGLKGANIQVFCDNSSAVTVLNSGSTKSTFLNDCLRELWFYAAKFELFITAVHLPGVDNHLPDLLSRWDKGDNKNTFLSLFEHGVEININNNLFYFENDL